MNLFSMSASVSNLTREGSSERKTRKREYLHTHTLTYLPPTFLPTYSTCLPTHLTTIPTYHTYLAACLHTFSPTDTTHLQLPTYSLTTCLPTKLLPTPSPRVHVHVHVMLHARVHPTLSLPACSLSPIKQRVETEKGQSGQGGDGTHVDQRRPCGAVIERRESEQGHSRSS